MLAVISGAAFFSASALVPHLYVPSRLHARALITLCAQDEDEGPVAETFGSLAVPAALAKNPNDRNFQTAENREDGSDFDEIRTKKIAATQAV